MHIVVGKDWPIEKVIALAKEKKPKYIFFPFYSKILPPELYENYECVVFHMTDLPYGRGGSPLQNLIIRGHTETFISAMKVNGVIDGGDIYQWESYLSLYGTAEEIYIRAEEKIKGMIESILENKKPIFEPQKGKIVKFKRRTPEQSNVFLTDINTVEELFDFIRMLDADTYPKAFIIWEDFRLEFTRASLKKGYILADVKITCRE